ncbi:MAG: DUF4380 domain-containing protein [Mameliella sp.]|nr:DUF4380 domain-containing protein [Phaeodactylibacter sp.]
MKHIFFLGLILAVFMSCGRKPSLTIRSGELKMSVDAQTGGRIASLTGYGIDFLKTQRDSQNLQWGSTVWPAPQSAWGWPPPKLMDQAPYEVVAAGQKRIVLRSPANAYFGLQLEKSFAALGPDTISVTYTFVNKGAEAVRVGIWENARVPLSGKAVWQSAENPADSIPGWNRDGGTINLQLGRHDQKHKLFLEATTPWLLHEIEGVSLKRSWAPFSASDVAPGQAPVEIYYDPFAKFAELEIQGPYEILAPGSQSVLQVYWTVRSEKH